MVDWPTFELGAAFGYQPGWPTPTFEDISEYMQEFVVYRGRKGLLDQIEAAQAKLVLRNAQYRFNPLQTTYYYNAGEGRTNLISDVPMRLRYQHAPAGGTTINGGIYRGWNRMFPISRANHVTLSLYDALHALSLIPIGTPDIPLQISQQDTGSYAQTALVAAGFDASQMDIETGLSTMGTPDDDDHDPDIYVDARAKQLVQLAADTEDGIVYVDGVGRIVFRNRTYRARNADVWVRFGAPGTADPGVYPADPLVLEMNPENLHNQVTVTPHRWGSSVTVSDSDSKALHWTRPATRTVHLPPDALGSTTYADEMASHANTILARHKDQRPYLTQLIVHGHQLNNSGWQAMLQMDIGDVIRVLTPDTDGNGIKFYVEGIKYHIAQCGEDVTFTLNGSPFEFYNYMILDNAAGDYSNGAALGRRLMF